MQIEFIFGILCFTLIGQGYRYLLSIFTQHEQLNNFVHNLATSTVTGVEFHNNTENLGWSTKTVGCKAKVIHELDGNFMKRGVSSTSIEEANYTLKGVCQTSTGWLAFYVKTAAPYTNYYKFKLWADNFASSTDFTLTTESGFLNVYGGYLFSYDGTCAYFYQNETSILKVNLTSSTTETIPFEHFFYYGTTKYTYSDHIITDGTNVYYFDELQLENWKRYWNWNVTGQGFAQYYGQLFFFDGTFFYFPYGQMISEGLYAGSAITRISLIAKKVV